MEVGSPALGWIASHAGLGAIFLASAIVVFCTAGIALRLMQRSAPA
jgi:hypothetical protein